MNFQYVQLYSVPVIILMDLYNQYDLIKHTVNSIAGIVM